MRLADAGPIFENSANLPLTNPMPLINPRKKAMRV